MLSNQESQESTKVRRLAKTTNGVAMVQPRTGLQEDARAAKRTSITMNTCKAGFVMNVTSIYVKIA